MARRRDGKETKKRLLVAAREVFSKKGYHFAKVAEICDLADANMAAVNYYFGDKANLYTETFKHTYEQYAESLFCATKEGSIQEKFRQYIKHILYSHSQRGPLWAFSRLYTMEVLNPTGLVRQFWMDFIDPRREDLQRAIRELMGKEVDHQTVVLCELSIINQCRLLSTIRTSDLESFLESPLDEEMTERMVDHITVFSLAGIKAVAEGK